MKKNLMLAASLGLTTSLMAIPVEITIPDGQTGNGATSPWSGTTGHGPALEDNETEPRTHTGDIWDLEAFVYDPATAKLSLIGTFDFKNGVNGVGSGAIFLRAIGSPAWSYAYGLNFGNNSFTLYDSFTTIAPTDVPASTPYSINTGTAHSIGTGSFTYSTGILDPFGLGLMRQSGVGHNQVDLGLGALPPSLLNGFDVHFTMTCGNDVIEGRYNRTGDRQVPDGGATAVLFGVSGLGMLLVHRRTRK